MSKTKKALLTGGCQCGAARYALYAEPTGTSICHCRMCQKAVGNYFAAFAGVKVNELEWTRGAPAVFRSSEAAERGFCRDCGTPLYYRMVDTKRISVSVGSLDQPERVHAEKQYGTEAVLPDFASLHTLPGETTDHWLPAGSKRKFASRQHPDHDTPEEWAPPRIDRRSK
jgi:hypothetical protein